MSTFYWEQNANEGGSFTTLADAVCQANDVCLKTEKIYLIEEDEHGHIVTTWDTAWTTWGTLTTTTEYNQGLPLA